MHLENTFVHAQSTTLFNIPPAFCEDGPLFRLGTVTFSPSIWEIVPAMFLGRALDLHSCGIFGDLEQYEIESNYANIQRLEEYQQGSKCYVGAIFSRWCPPGYPPFNVSTYCFSTLFTDVVAKPD